jgi:hypothetical protein
MKARDTVMNLGIWDDKQLQGEVQRAIEAQAEISFRAGIKEVARWMGENFADFMPQHTKTALMGKRWQRWQAKLREWGIDGT